MSRMSYWRRWRLIWSRWPLRVYEICRGYETAGYKSPFPGERWTTWRIVFERTKDSIILRNWAPGTIYTAKPER